MVKLYTRQDIRSLNIVTQTGLFYNKSEYVHEYYGAIASELLKSYAYFVHQANKIIPKPEYITLPIWCAIDSDNWMPIIDGTVGYELDVPEENIIYFDGMKWDYVINHRYLPLNDDDERRYLEKLEYKNISNPYIIFDNPHYSFERQQIIQSWQRIFNTENSSIYTIQANIWYIKHDWIVNIIYPSN